MCSGLLDLYYHTEGEFDRLQMRNQMYLDIYMLMDFVILSLRYSYFIISYVDCLPFQI